MGKKTLLYHQTPYGAELIVHVANPHFVILCLRNELQSIQIAVPLDITQATKLRDYMDHWLTECAYKPPEAP